MASEEAQANVNSRMEQAMEDLARKGEMQQQAKLVKEQLAEEQRLKDEEEQEIQFLRTQRLDRMKREQGQEEKSRTKGHGEVNLITEDEFLPTVLGSARVVVHFFSEEFESCQLMNAQLDRLSQLHLECRFVKILAAKAPFFVDRFGIQTLPCLVCFEDGKAVGKKVGFRGEDSLLDVERYLFESGILKAVLCVPQTAKQRQAKQTREEEDDADW